MFSKENFSLNMNIDTINLLVFANGVSFRKSKKASMVAMLSLIIELPRF